MVADGKKSAEEGVLGKRDVYQIGENTITKAAAANFIADALFPGRGRRAAYKRVHKRIDEAQLKGKLPKLQAMQADILFGWAAEEKGWAKLHEIPGISISTSVFVIGSAVEAQVGEDVSGVPSPRKIKSLVQSHAQTVQKLESAERKIAALKGPITAKQQKKDALSAAQSENGKKGGRGNEK
jgi:hypothetical protein